MRWGYEGDCDAIGERESFGLFQKFLGESGWYWNKCSGSWNDHEEQ